QATYQISSSCSSLSSLSWPLAACRRRLVWIVVLSYADPLLSVILSLSIPSMFERHVNEKNNPCRHPDRVRCGGSLSSTGCSCTSVIQFNGSTWQKVSCAARYAS